MTICSILNYRGPLASFFSQQRDWYMPRFRRTCIFVERSADDMYVPTAISAFVMHYFLSFGSRYARGYVLLPTLLLFLTALTLALVILLGSQARSKAGIRIAMAGVFTLAAFVCRIGHDIYQSPFVRR